jgi:hypothetical protein
MNAGRIELALVLKKLGRMPLELDSFAKRFDLQKRVYLAQVSGADLGYRYGWYLHGPYCRGLTADAFLLRDEIADGERDHEKYTLRDDISERLERATVLSRRPAAFRGTDAEWLELLASLHYLRHIVYCPRGERPGFEQAFEMLTETKPQFAGRKGDAKLAWQGLDEVGLIKAKVLS